MNHILKAGPGVYQLKSKAPYLHRDLALLETIKKGWKSHSMFPGEHTWGVHYFQALAQKGEVKFFVAYPQKSNEEIIVVKLKDPIKVKQKDLNIKLMLIYLYGEQGAKSETCPLIDCKCDTRSHIKQKNIENFVKSQYNN